MRLALHPDVERDLEEAAAYYEDREPGLGAAFTAEVEAAILRICQFPDAGVAISLNARRYLTSRFPYGVIYQRTPDTVRIIAVANLHRRAGYWRMRL